MRNGTPAVQKEYEVGQAFEQMLVSTLASSISPSGEGEGESEGSGGAGGGATQSLVSSMVPQALAGAIATGKGLGIAEQLTREMAANTPGGTVGAPGSPNSTLAASTVTAGGGVESDATGGTAA